MRTLVCCTIFKRVGQLIKNYFYDLYSTFRSTTFHVFGRRTSMDLKLTHIDLDKDFIIYEITKSRIFIFKSKKSDLRSIVTLHTRTTVALEDSKSNEAELQLPNSYNRNFSSIFTISIKQILRICFFF